MSDEIFITPDDPLYDPFARRAEVVDSEGNSLLPSKYKSTTVSEYALPVEGDINNNE